MCEIMAKEVYINQNVQVRNYSPVRIMFLALTFYLASKGGLEGHLKLMSLKGKSFGGSGMFWGFFW